MSKGNELKPHIGLFGRRNYGKSSLINALTGQNIAIVSNTPGTTTDPVRKTMELLGVGPVVWIDTAGIDDEGPLGALRVEKSLAVLPQCDLALILFSNNLFDTVEQQLVDRCREAGIPFIPVYSRADAVPPDPDLLALAEKATGAKVSVCSSVDPVQCDALAERVRRTLPPTAYSHRTLLGDVINPGDLVVMVTPIDSAAPEGRMILPQVQVLRDILDCGARALVCKEDELQHTLDTLPHPPALVVTDSQVFGMVAAIVPQQVPLTSFSITLARQNSLFADYVKGTPVIDSLKPGDRVLLLESCTHNVTCDDIGRVKLPRLLSKHAGGEVLCDVVSGLSNPSRPLTDYKLVIQCGGCVLTPRQIASRLQPALNAGVPVSNYGLALAFLNGIFQRAMQPFKLYNDTLSLIVAVSQNMVIGNGGDLPWHIHGDMKRFKQLTMGHTVIMGRRTWLSLPKRPLAGRRNIVLTHDTAFQPDGAEVAHSVAQLLKMVQHDDQPFIIGGATVYNQLMPFVNRLYVTWVYRDFEGDTTFPAIDPSRFMQVGDTDLHTDPENNLQYGYAEYALRHQ